MTPKPSATTATGAERFAWCLFDFANSAFNTVVVTFVYAQFFSRGLVGDPQRGDALWGYVVAFSGVVIALLSPVLGAMADRSGKKRRFLLTSAVITIAATALLFLPRPDDDLGHASEATIAMAMVLVAVALVAFEVMFVFYNAFLPSLAPPDRIGRLSGKGWAFGYVGGLLCLVLCLASTGGLGGEAWFGGGAQRGMRATNLIVAVWFALFALPAFVLLRDRAAPAPGLPGAGGALRDVLGAVARLPRRPDLLRLLLARLFYNDALMAVITLSGLYMATTLQMSLEQILWAGILLNVVAGVGALTSGYIDDRFGAKTTLVGSVLLLMAGTTLAIAVPTVAAFHVAASLVGLGMGPNQAASRTMLARFVPVDRAAEYYGLFALSGKATVWLGPLLFALVRSAVDDQRVAMAPLLVLFSIGLFILVGIDERRGMAEAGHARGGTGGR